MVWDIASSYAHEKKRKCVAPFYKKNMCIHIHMSLKKIHQVMKKHDLGGATIKFVPPQIHSIHFVKNVVLVFHHFA